MILSQNETFISIGIGVEVMSNKVSPTEQICMNAMHELIQDKVIGKISVQDVLDKVGISKATFYRHYADKYDLYEKMVWRDVGYIFSDSCELYQWQDRIHTWLRSTQEDKATYVRMQRADPNGFLSFYSNLIYGLFTKRLRRIDKSMSSPGVELHTRILFMSAGIAALYCDWIKGNCQTSSVSVAEAIIKMITAVAQGTKLSAS